MNISSNLWKTLTLPASSLNVLSVVDRLSTKKVSVFSPKEHSYCDKRIKLLWGKQLICTLALLLSTRLHTLCGRSICRSTCVQITQSWGKGFGTVYGSGTTGALVGSVTDSIYVLILLTLGHDTLMVWRNSTFTGDFLYSIEYKNRSITVTSLILSVSNPDSKYNWCKSNLTCLNFIFECSNGNYNGLERTKQ